MNIQENIPLAKYTTLKIGGPARYFIEILSEVELKEAILWARDKGVEYIVIAGGSNLLVSDAGFDGMVVKLAMSGITQRRGDGVTVKVGVPLQMLVDFANEHGLAGAEKLTGIPGSVGGAIYGNAGAYGQTVSDKITRILIWDGIQNRWLKRQECGFEYRDSGFKKHKDWIILEAEFSFDEGKREVLQETSIEILNRRLQKYPHGVRCPGSFFKNLLKDQLSEEYRNIIPPDYYGKMPAGYFLDMAGAKGDRLGDIEIAPYHANLFTNKGNGKASDFFALAKKWKDIVREKFGIELEPEVQLVGFREEL